MELGELRFLDKNKYIEDSLEINSDLMKDIRDVHKKLFPLANIASQCHHFDQEVHELQKALDKNHGDIHNKDVLYEVADVIISACGITRFNNSVGFMIFCALKYNLFAYERLEIINALCEKMNKNMLRDWEYLGNGDYHHVVSTDE